VDGAHVRLILMIVMTHNNRHLIWPCADHHVQAISKMAFQDGWLGWHQESDTFAGRCARVDRARIARSRVMPAMSAAHHTKGVCRAGSSPRIGCCNGNTCCVSWVLLWVNMTAW
jgi:hypothetical protein